jgi:hypothetical protein
MRSFILTLLIVSNTVGGIEVASDFNDVWADSVASTFTDELPSDSANSTSNPQEAGDCDHCGAHFTGFVAVIQPLTFYRSIVRIPFSDIHYQFAGHAPPTPPPNV